MILKPNPVSTRQLHWQPAYRRFIGDISDTHGFGRVYDDACDEGLTLISERTGREVVFAVDNVVRDREGEIQWWDLKPANPAQDLIASVRLYND